MFSFAKKFILSITVLFFLSGCIEFLALSAISSGYVLARDKTVKQTAIDSKILTELTAKLTVKNRNSAYRNVLVSVYKGRVLLVGHVKNEVTEQRVEKHAWDISGVVEVINELSIDEDGNTRNSMVDSYLTSRVKSRLVLSNEVDALDINVTVYNSDVYLLGTVKNEGEIRNAADLSARVRGVEKVISHLRVVTYDHVSK